MGIYVPYTNSVSRGTAKRTVFRMKQTETITTAVEKPDDSSSIQTGHSKKAKIAGFARRLSLQHDSLPKSQKKEMELAQRRIEAVARYEKNLQERIDDDSATAGERAKAASEKRLYDSKTLEWKENWVLSRMTLKEGWGAGVYPEGACGPGMWYR